MLEPGTKVRHCNSHGEAVLSSPAVWVPYFSRGRTPRGAYVPPKPVLCFFLFTGQWQCLPALCSTSSQKLPKTQWKTACNAKRPKTPSQRAHSLLPSDFDAVKSYLHQVLDLKLFPTSGKSSQSLKNNSMLIVLFVHCVCTAVQALTTVSCSEYQR